MRDNWFLIGDIHGDVKPIRDFYNEYKYRLNLDKRNNHIILLGDVGCNYSISGMRDHNFKEELSRYPFTYICLRGNHEARVKDMKFHFPDKWTSCEKYGGTIYVEKEFPRIEYLLDSMAIYTFGGYKTLSIPGAYSMDKGFRLAYEWPWFANEQLSEREMEAGLELIDRNPSVDLVISHTCPLQDIPGEMFLGVIDFSRVDQKMEKYMSQVEVRLDYKRWAFGHYHLDKLFPWDGVKERMMLLHRVVDLDKFMKMSQNDYWDEIMPGLPKKALCQ